MESFLEQYQTEILEYLDEYIGTSTNENGEEDPYDLSDLIRDEMGINFLDIAELYIQYKKDQ